MVKLGLVGVGFMGSTHSACYELLCKQMDVKVTAVADINIEKAKNIAEKFGAVVYGSAQELIDQADVNTVDICLPTFLHTEYAIKAMKKGFNIFIEKPVCLTEEEAQKLLDTQRETGSEVMVGQCMRLWSEYVYLKEVVESREYGTLQSAVFKRISPRPDWAWDGWLTDTKRSGSAVLDLHIHDVDFIRYILGDPRSIQSLISTTDGKPEHAFAIYTYDDAVVSVEGGWDYPPCFPFEMEYRVKFEKATIVFNSCNNPSVKAYIEGGKEMIPEIKKEFAGESSELGGNISSLGGYYNELKYFIDCLSNKKKITIAPLEEGIKSFRLVMREIASAGRI